MNFTERTVSRWKARRSNGSFALSLARRSSSFSSRCARKPIKTISLVLCAQRLILRRRRHIPLRKAGEESLCLFFTRPSRRILRQRPDIRLSPRPVTFLYRVAEVLPAHPPREGVKPFYAECSGHGFTLPLHDPNAHGHPCISTLQQMRPPFSIHPSYTTGESLVSYNQKFGDATRVL